MTTLYVNVHPVGLIVSTFLNDQERQVIEDVRLLLIPGEEFCGLSFDQLAQIAGTTHKIDIT